MGTLAGDLAVLWIGVGILFIVLAMIAAETPYDATVDHWVANIAAVLVVLAAIVVTILQLVGIIGVW